jgi:NAD-dependent SIR2 family protein deacetylase
LIKRRCVGLIQGMVVHEARRRYRASGKMTTAIFLGAGASAAEGAPVQSDLFYEYFRAPRRRTEPRRSSHLLENAVRQMNAELATFFDQMFGVDVFDTGNLRTALFPTFEEALGILDLAERRKESLKDFDLENMATNSNRIRFVRQYLVMLMATVLHDKLKTSGTMHRTLAAKLHGAGRIRETVFITTNYDILIDNALTKLHTDGVLLDYGIDFTNFDQVDDWRRPDDSAVKLYKIHGSLNWLFCPTCNTVTLTPKEKGIIVLITDFQKSRCPSCGSVIVPIVVPPTYFKDMSNLFLSVVWHKAEQALRRIDHVVFCGYSFPDADIHIKYLIKRVQTNRTQRLRFTVCNNHHGKNPALADEEKRRYKRFLGASVEYTDRSFDDFAKDPVRWL